LRRPKEVNAVQKSDEKWRVSQRRESAANVRNKNDEKYDNVSFASPELIGPDNRSNQNHGGAGSADHTSNRRTKREHPSIRPWSRPNSAGHKYAARHGIKRKEQEDKA
jgi:hypothetical protein